MAYSRTRANTATQISPGPPEFRTLLNSSATPAKILESSRQDPLSPPFANPWKETEPAVNLANIAHLSSIERFSGAGSSWLSYKPDQDHDSRTQNNEPYTMFESPARSCDGSANIQTTPKGHARGVSYAPSAPSDRNSDKRPPRQDSAYFSLKSRDDGSELDVEIQARQIRARERVVILRGKVLRTRRLRKEQKGKLRQLQENVRSALNKFTRKINELVALGTPQDLQTQLSPYYDSLRAAQDELGPAEDAYDHLENRLDEEEQDLEEEEDHFYRHNDVLSFSVPDSKLDDELSPLVKPYQPPESVFDDISLENEEVQDYLSKVEEAERLKEELDDLETDYYRLSVDANFRKRHGIQLSKETTDFLENYPNEYKQTLENLHRIEDALFDLREDCINQGFFAEFEHVYEPRDALCEDVMESVYEARERSPLRVAIDRRSEYEIDFKDKRDYINKWLLEWVQDSTLDTMMLHAWIYFEYPDSKHRNEDLGEDKWTDLALENWDKDSAGEMANTYFNASKLDAITGETADTGHLGANSTTRSDGLSRSLSSLAEIAEEDLLLEEAEVGSITTEKRQPELTRTKQSAQPSTCTETMPKSLQDKHPTLVAPQPSVLKASSLNSVEMSLGHTSRSLHWTTELPRRAKSADHRPRDVPAFQLQGSSSETDLSTLRVDTSTLADLQTHSDPIAQPVDNLDYSLPNFSQSNASLLSDLCIPLSDVLS